MASEKISAVIFVTALVVRLLNAPMIASGARPNLTPLDDLYHWKRISFSAAHFPAVLEFDPDRGERGAYCPWPPAYDLFCGVVARLFGMSSIMWIPPILGALATGAAAFFIAKGFGARAGIAAGIALATSPFIVTESSVGDIDHHFLEWPLAFAILGAACLILKNRSWIPLAIAMTLAMFVQTAMLVACGLAFIGLFVSCGDGLQPVPPLRRAKARRHTAAAIAFSVPAVAIALYRVTRPPDFPNSPWFLGWPHAALFAGAAIACVLRKWPAIALLAGAVVGLAFPSAIAVGSHFFGGDPWLSTISEFQPVWKGNLDDWISHAAGFSIGAIFVWDLARRAIRDRDKILGAIVIFALAYLPLAISSRRFEATAIPLLALAGAVDAAMILRRSLAMFAAAAVALIPAVQLALWMMHPLPPISTEQQAWIRSADFLRTQPPGRVLAPWSMGHCLDVLGTHAVVIDNFGTMPDRGVFERAIAALGSRDLTSYCNRAGVRYVVRSSRPGARFRLLNSPGLTIWEYAGGR